MTALYSCVLAHKRQISNLVQRKDDCTIGEARLSSQPFQIPATPRGRFGGKDRSGLILFDGSLSANAAVFYGSAAIRHMVWCMGRLVVLPWLHKSAKHGSRISNSPHSSIISPLVLRFTSNPRLRDEQRLQIF